MLGKGFKGNCDTCGIIGHTKHECPKGQGKGDGIHNIDATEENSTGGINLGGSPSDDTQGPAQATKRDVDHVQDDNYQGFQHWGCPEYFGYDNSWDGIECYILTREEKGDQEENTKFKEDVNLGSWQTVGKGRRGQQGQHHIMNVDKKSGNEYEWVRENAIVDSGTIDTVSGLKHIEKGRLKETIASKKGMNWTAASGDSIKNMGEGAIQGRSNEGIPVDFTTQVGDKISKMLISVGRTGEAGNMTVFNADMNALREIVKRDKIEEHFFYNKKSGITSKINKEGGLYKYPIWIKRKKEGEMCNTITKTTGNDEIDDLF